MLHPHASDASVQAIFEWERAHDRGSANRRRGFAQVRNTGARVVAVAGRVLPRRDASAPGRADRRDGRAATRANPVPSSKPAATALAGLVEHGYVILDDRWLPFARARLDHVVIGPAGLFVIESRAWPGQLGITDNELFVDGRRRIGATEEVLRTTAAVEEALAHELKPLGAPVKSVLCIWRATPQWFKGSVRGVLVTNGRALARAIREGEQVLGPETVVRLALAADRLLE